MDLIGLLIDVIVFGLIYWLVVYVLPLPAPFKTAAIVIMVIIFILFLLDQVGYLGGGFSHRPLLR
jgi:hypothetical protein